MCTPGNCHLFSTNPLDGVHLLTLAPQRCKGTVDSLNELSNKPLVARTEYSRHASGANYRLLSCELWYLHYVFFCCSLKQFLMCSSPINVCYPEIMILQRNKNILRVDLHKAFYDNNEGAGQNGFSYFISKPFFPVLVGENSATVKRSRQNP